MEINITRARFDSTKEKKIIQLKSENFFCQFSACFSKNEQVFLNDYKFIIRNILNNGE